MNKPNEALRDRLLNIEKLNDTPRKIYEKEVQAMIRKELSAFGRVCFGLLLLIGILFIMFFVGMLLSVLPGTNPNNFVRITYPFVILGLILSGAWVILLGYLVISGKCGLRINLSLITGIGLAISFLVTIIFTLIQEYGLVRANPQDWRVKMNEQLAVAIFFMLVFIGLYLIIRALYRLEFKTQEKLLEIELRLGELGEKIENRHSD